MAVTTGAIYGQAPKSLGIHDFPTGEMMFWLYCPVKMPDSFNVEFNLPDNLMQFHPMIERVRKDVLEDFGAQRWVDSYVYLTAKTLHVSEQSPGNRLGWHSDGFLTDDLNYVWIDRNPTLYWETNKLFPLTADHNVALDELDARCCLPAANQGERIVK